MKGLGITISFFEAHFKVHYTKKFRLSYPIPLPTTVAGIFGAILGISRIEIFKKFKNLFFGAKLVKPFSEVYEMFTFLQYPWNKPTWPPGVIPIQILNEPTYKLFMAGEEDKIVEFKRRIETGYIYLPYGGQNDFFVKSINVNGIFDIELGNVISNYAPKSFVDDIFVSKDYKEGSFLTALPVMHKFDSSSEPFYFSYGMNLKLKRKIYVVEKTGLYELKGFFYPITTG